jgi:hypothetical protein
MAKRMNETKRSRRTRLNRGTSGWAEGDYATAKQVLAYWRARMDRLRVSEVAKELENMEQRALLRMGWMEQAERAGTVDSEYATKAFGLVARHERALAEQLKALREKLGWCFHRE